MTNEEKIAQLEASLTGDMIKDMDIRQEIHDLEMSEKGVSCSIDDPECEACGSQITNLLLLQEDFLSKPSYH